MILWNQNPWTKLVCDSPSPMVLAVCDASPAAVLGMPCSARLLSAGYGVGEHHSVCHSTTQQEDLKKLTQPSTEQVKYCFFNKFRLFHKYPIHIKIFLVEYNLIYTKKNKNTSLKIKINNKLMYSLWVSMLIIKLQADANLGTIFKEDKLLVLMQR